MKKACLILLLLVCAHLEAQHWLGVSVDAGLSWQPDRMAVTTAKTGGGAGLGFRYQLQAGYFIVETGLGAAYTKNLVGLSDTVLRFSMRDDHERTFTYIGRLHNRTDMSRSLSLNLPLLVGGEYGAFYGMAGVTASLKVLSRTQQTAQLATSGEYKMYYEELTNMPGHGFHDYETVESRGKMSCQMDLRVTAETGAVFYSADDCHKFRIGLYVAYGLFDARQFDTGPLLVPDLTAGMQVGMNHVYTTGFDATSAVHNLLCGVRFTMFVNVSAGPSNRYGRY